MKLKEIFEKSGVGVAIARKEEPMHKYATLLGKSTSDSEMIVVEYHNNSVGRVSLNIEDFVEWHEEIKPLKQETFYCIENVLGLEVQGDDEIKFVEASVLEKRLIEWTSALKGNLDNIELPLEINAGR
jgi:hypothetical protein